MTSREWIDLYAGTYTDQGSRGIYALRYNQVTGEAQAVEAMTVPHPSFLTIAPDGRHLYAISEVSEGARGTMAVTSIKDMPAFDPDADINGLALTIPSWSSSIDRVLKRTDLSIISSHAREGLVRQLLSLTDHVSDLLDAIKED